MATSKDNRKPVDATDDVTEIEVERTDADGTTVDETVEVEETTTTGTAKAKGKSKGDRPAKGGKGTRPPKAKKADRDRRIAAEPDTVADDDATDGLAKEDAVEDDADDDGKVTPTKRSRRRGDRPQPLPGMNPTWWAPVMVGLMVVGLLWIVVFYILSDGPDNTWPVPGIGYGNLAIGFGLIMVGFMMTTRWK